MSAGQRSEDLLETALAGVERPPEKVWARLVRLLDLLLEHRGAGITGFGSPEALAHHYFREALALGRLLPEDGPYLDVGSGGGTPALPLAVEKGHWTLLEPRRAAAGFLDLAVEALGIGSRVRVCRCKLIHFLKDPENSRFLGDVSAVTMRAVKLSGREWTGLAATLSGEAVVLWPTSSAGRDRAAMTPGLFVEESVPAERGIVWVGRPRGEVGSGAVSAAE